MCAVPPLGLPKAFTVNIYWDGQTFYSVLIAIYIKILKKEKEMRGMRVKNV